MRPGSGEHHHWLFPKQTAVTHSKLTGVCTVKCRWGDVAFTASISVIPAHCKYSMGRVADSLKFVVRVSKLKHLVYKDNINCCKLQSPT